MSVAKRTVKVKLPAYRYDEIATAAGALGVTVADFMAAAATETASAVRDARAADLAELVDGLDAARIALDGLEGPDAAAVGVEIGLITAATETATGDPLADHTDLIAAALRRLTGARDRINAIDPTGKAQARG